MQQGLGQAARYIRAFFVALRMTLRGEKPPTPRHTALLKWIDQAAGLLEDLYTLAESAGMRRTEREQLVVRVDGRNTNMEMILNTLKYHLHEEYVDLLRHESRHILTAIYASNINDHYRLLRLAEQLAESPLLTHLSRLAAHLETIPQVAL